MPTSTRERASIGCCGRCTGGSGAISTGACASCSRSPRSKSDGGRDILRAAEVTPDPLLRRLYLEHAIDELRHGDLFRQRGAALLRLRSTASDALFDGDAAARRAWPRRSVDRRRAGSSAARVPARGGKGRRRPLRDLSRCRRRRSADARDLRGDSARRSVPHELHVHAARPASRRSRTAGRSGRRAASRLWKRYLRVAAAVAGVIGSAMLTLMYFVVLPPFAWLAKRARAPRAGRLDADPARRDDESPTSQY